MRNTNHPGLGLAVLCSLALLAGACGGSGNTTGAKCTSNTDCNNGQSCVSGVCKATSGSGGSGAACKSASDCSATQNCTNGKCVDKCQGIVCNQGQVCDNTSGTCVQCTSSSDCASGQTCDTSTHTCTGGSTGGGGGAQGPACTAGSSNACGQQQTCQNGHCQPSEYGDCSKLACATGLTCKTFQTQSGPQSFCLQACSATTDCSNLGDACDTGSGDIAKGFCLQSLCGPSLANTFQGLQREQKASFGSTCNAAGTGDGYCFGPVGMMPSATGGSGTPVGLCLGNGQVAPGGTCDTTASYSKLGSACNAGLCNATSSGSTSGICIAFCAIADGQTCAPLSVGGQTMNTACFPIAEVGGVCIPQSSSPAATGASCTPMGGSNNQLSCVSDDACLTSGSSSTCVQLCNMLATTSTCASGTTCQADANGDKILGNCK